mgnify:CR=1 FL=1
MKTLKLALVAAIVAFTMINVTYADGFRTNPKFKMVHNVALENAIKNPELVRAMYEQLTLAEVLQVQQHNNPATVIMKGETYKIYGTSDQWRRFFVMDGTHGAKAKPKDPVVE